MMDALTSWDGIGALYWRESWWLWACGFPLLWWLFSVWRRKQHWQKIAAPEFKRWLQAGTGSALSLNGWSPCHWRVVLASLGWGLLCVALAGPRFPDTVTNSALMVPDQVVLLMDRSASMAARDHRFSRQQQAQRIAQRWVNQDDAVHWGLVLFAGHAHRIAPVTTDHRFIRQRVRDLLTLPLPTLGNDLAGALREAGSAFSPAEPEAPRHIVLFSDGDLEAAEKQAAEKAVKDLAAMSPAPLLHVIGMGGHRAVPIPNRDQGWLEQGGSPVLSQRDQGWLKHLATLAQGRYYPVEGLTEQTADLRRALGLGPRRIPEAGLQDVIWVEVFPVPLIIGMVMLFLALLSRAGKAPKKAIPSVLACLLCTGLGVSPMPSDANEDVLAQAQQAMIAQDWPTARDHYRDLEGYEARFAEGVACYRMKDWSCSTEAWGRAVLLAAGEEQTADRLRAIFNLGDAYFRMGRFDEAQVLFEDLLKQWQDSGPNTPVPGLSRAQVETNLSYARDLAAAVEREIADRQKALRRAAFKARAGLLDGRTQEGGGFASGSGSDFADDMVNTDRALIRSALQRLDPAQLAAMGIDLDLNQNRPSQIGSAGSAAQQDFNRTEFDDQTGQTVNAQAVLIWKRLLEMEVGIPAALDQPRTVQGKRPW